MNMPIISEPRQLTAGDVRAQANLIQEVMKSVMRESTHYGKIPGCDQPSLYKAGSEVILSTFRIAVDPQVEDLSTLDVIRYRVKAVGIHQTSGIVVGTGIGECSTDEDKYKWRSAVCQAEFDDTPENRRRIKYYRNGGTAKQVRTNPADLANTVLKMAKKRAQIDLTLTATAASDLFTQDIEDLPEGYVSSFQDTRPAAQEQEAKPTYTDEQMQTNLPGWKKAIAANKADPAFIIKKVSSSYTLSDEQIKTINKLTQENNNGNA